MAAFTRSLWRIRSCSATQAMMATRSFRVAGSAEELRNGSLRDSHPTFQLSHCRMISKAAPMLSRVIQGGQLCRSARDARGSRMRVRDRRDFKGDSS